jgi:chaperonin GroEL (HSP60 family)
VAAVIPAQVIRALGTACWLAGLETEHAQAVRASDLDALIDLLDALIEAVGASRPTRETRVERMAAARPRVAELAGQGKSDPEIAEAIGAIRTAVRAIRRRYEIPAGVPGGGAALRSGWEARLRELLARVPPLTRAELAEAMGYTPRTLQQRLSDLRRMDEPV